jgi:tetratricopeptide (TPR) repeat protein
VLRLTLALVVLAAGFVFVNLPVRATEDTWWFRLARATGLPTRIETTANAHYNLGVTYAADAKTADRAGELLERAEAELRLAVAERPEDPKYRIELGKVLARQQRNEEAIEVYREAARLAPGDYHVYHVLGLLHRRTGDLDAAAGAFRAALRVAPRFVPSAVELGQVLLEAGRPAEAAKAFRYALRLRPGDAEAVRGLKQAESAAPGG